MHFILIVMSMTLFPLHHTLIHTRVCARARVCNLTNVLSNETQTKEITFAEERLIMDVAKAQQ
jgi:hypothetical protein